MRARETSYWPCSCWCRRPLRTDPSGRMRSVMPSGQHGVGVLEVARAEALGAS
jgi:hypothetical protein